MQLEIKTKSRVLAGLLRDDQNKPEGVLIKLPPPSYDYEKRDITIQEIIITFFIVVSGNVISDLVSHWLIKKIKRYDPNAKITYNGKEIDVSEKGIKRTIEENIEIDKTT